MAAPDIPFLSEFAETLSFTPPSNKDGFESEIIAESTETLEITTVGQRIAGKSREVRLWYKQNGGFTLQTLASIVGTQLRRKGHLVDKQTALSVIGLSLILGYSNSKAERLFENIVLQRKIALLRKIGYYYET